MAKDAFDHQFTFHCIEQWLHIANKHGYDAMRGDYTQFCINMRKSALLKRLLAGKKPFPLPPPKSFSYPWYSLLEENEYAGFMDASYWDHRGGRLLVQQAPWFIVEKLGDNHYLIQYSKEEGSVWELSPMTFDEVYALQRPRSIQAEEKFVEWCKQSLDKYSRLKLHTPGKNTIKNPPV